jgi:hypothetical protein
VTFLVKDSDDDDVRCDDLEADHHVHTVCEPAPRTVVTGAYLAPPGSNLKLVQNVVYIPAALLGTFESVASDTDVT